MSTVKCSGYATAISAANSAAEANRRVDPRSHWPGIEPALRCRHDRMRIEYAHDEQAAEANGSRVQACTDPTTGHESDGTRRARAPRESAEAQLVERARDCARGGDP